MKFGYTSTNKLSQLSTILETFHNGMSTITRAANSRPTTQLRSPLSCWSTVGGMEKLVIVAISLILLIFFIDGRKHVTA